MGADPPEKSLNINTIQVVILWVGKEEAAILLAGFSAKTLCWEASDSGHVGVCTMPSSGALVL